MECQCQYIPNLQYFLLLVNPHGLKKAGDDLEEVEVGLPAMSVLATAQQLGRMEL